MQAQYEAYNIICFIIMKLSAALLIRKLSDNCITEYVTQAKNVVDFFFWMSSLCFLKHNLGATLPLARRIPEQQGSSGNIWDITEMQFQIQLIIKAGSIIFICSFKTWKKPVFSLSYWSYAYLRVVQLAVKFWNLYNFVQVDSKLLISNNKAMQKTL